MKALENKVVSRFKELLIQHLAVHKVIVFGSRARGDADPDSDMDVLVILSGRNDVKAREIANNCAWEAGFEHGIVIAPIVISRQAWENGPERYSLLAQAVEREGITV